MWRRPEAVLNINIVKNNIKRMCEKYKLNTNIDFRPHFKTHQSLVIGQLFKPYDNVTGCTVSSISMAEYFSKEWKNMTLAVPFNPMEIERLNNIIMKDDVKLELVVDNEKIIDIINEKIIKPVDIWLKIDAGYGRAGINHQQVEKAIKLSKSVESAKKLNFLGCLSHFGNTYNCINRESIHQVFEESLDRMQKIQSEISNTLSRNVQISIGDTPSATICEPPPPSSNVTQVRPGNFVFYDIDQYLRRVCRLEDIALAISTPVISIYPEREEILLYCGAVHISKDHWHTKGRRIYGSIALPDKNGWSVIPIEDAWLRSLSQEVGIVKIEDGRIFERLAVGQAIYVLPFHSCLAAEQFQRYYNVETGDSIDRFVY